MAVYVALLRGINVGGKHKLPMRDLVPIFEEAGCRDVSTYIQSGNVLFEASAALAKTLPGVVEGAIEETFGFASPVVVRAARAVQGVLATNPLLDRGVDPKALAVAFSNRTPTAAALRSLEPQRFAPDRLVAQGGHVYLHYPGGAARSKLTVGYLDRTLGVIHTVRNWNTVTKLGELCAQR